MIKMWTANNRDSDRDIHLNNKKEYICEDEQKSLKFQSSMRKA